MDCVCDQFLPSARLARDEHGDVDAGRLAEDLARLHHLGTAPQIRLLSNSSVRLLESPPVRFGRRADEVVDCLLEFGEAQRLVQHGFHLERGSVDAIVVVVSDRDDRTGIRAAKLQTLNQSRFGGADTAEVDQSAAEAPVREGLQRFPRGGDCEALVPTASEKAEESRLRCRINFDHERSLLNHVR